MTHSRPLANHGYPSRDHFAGGLAADALNDSFMTTAAGPPNAANTSFSEARPQLACCRAWGLSGTSSTSKGT
jgi:hypothetical protein